jgi:uncharacterized protein (DUF427 family)
MLLARGTGRTIEATGKSMARAIWNGRVIADSDQIMEVEGTVYFPDSSLNREYFRNSSTTSTDPATGQKRYLTVVIDGQDNQDAAWYYPDPKPAARKLKGYVAFWRGVEIMK